VRCPILVGRQEPADRIYHVKTTDESRSFPAFLRASLTVMPQCALTISGFRLGTRRATCVLGAGEHEVRAAIIAVTGDPGPGRAVHHRRHKPGPRDDEIRRLRAEVARLSDLLRENGIEPGDGGRQTA
jgi:hypothetical protein